jgi:hypothetical protein
MTFQQHAICAIRAVDERPIVLIRDKPIFSSERVLHKDNDLKGLVEKNVSGRESQRAWRQDKLIGGKNRQS